MRVPAFCIAAFALAATPVFADASASAAIAKPGQMLRGSDQSRLGQIDHVNGDGSVQIIFDTNLVTIPADTLSMVDGKLMTSLSKNAVAGLR